MTQTMKKYADVVRAYLDGAAVQSKYKNDYRAGWVDNSDPQWNPEFEYHIKPKEPRIVEKYIPVGFNTGVDCNAHHHTRGVWRCTSVDSLEDNEINYTVIANIKIRCNEETGEVISVELIKDKV